MCFVVFLYKVERCVSLFFCRKWKDVFHCFLYKVESGVDARDFYGQGNGLWGLWVGVYL
jgi:hypothetical protein